MKAVLLKHITIILISIFAVSSSAYAERISISGALKQAFENNPELIAAGKRLDSAKARVPRTLSLDDPRLGQEYEGIPQSSSNPEDGMKMYTAEQMIMFPGKIYAEYFMAAKEADFFGANFNIKYLDISDQVRSAYYDLFLTDRSIEIMGEVSDILINIKRSAGLKYEVGEVSQADVLQANIEALIVKNELTTMKQERNVKEARLNALLNRDINSSIETDAALSLPMTLEAMTLLEKAAIEHRPELMAMKAELDMKDYAQLRAKMDFFPDTMIGIRNRQDDTKDYMINFSVPLYFWKQWYGQESAGFERAAAEAGYINMKNMTLWEIRESYVMSDAAKRTMLLYRNEIVPQSSQALKTALAAYGSGKMNFQSLLQIEKMYKESKLKYYEAQADYGRSLSRLGKIAGKSLI